MARVFLNLPQGMRMPGKPQGNFSDDEDGVQSGSATGFSDGEEMVHARPAKVVSNAFDPVNRILDKIDAELSSLTYSQGTSSTATDSTVVRLTPSHESTETSRLDSGSLTISQLGPSHKPLFSPLSSGSKRTVSSDRDTGIGTGTNSFQDSHHRSRDEQGVRDLEPGDDFRNASFGHPRRSNSPDLAILNGHHGQSDDDKSKRENMTASPFEAKQLDDRFKEIMQKRKGGFLTRASTDDETQTIRTEDFADKFQDTLIYPSSDEAERLRNIEEDLHSDGGSDTDTLQQKLVSLTQRNQRKPKVGGPGTPPVYPKPTPTNTLPRPSTRSSIKFTPGHNSDADSVRTEDFENQFKDLLVTRDNQHGDSESDTVTNDPIHAKVKELLKATAKYAGKPLAPVSNSILKSQLRPYTDKPKIEPKPKHHVRISSKPPQYQDQKEGDDSDDTLCSEREGRVASSRARNYIEGSWGTNRSAGREPTNFRRAHYPLWAEPAFPKAPLAVSSPSTAWCNIPSQSSFEESLSKSSLSSLSSSDRDKPERYSCDIIRQHRSSIGDKTEEFVYDPTIKLNSSDRLRTKSASDQEKTEQYMYDPGIKLCSRDKEKLERFLDDSGLKQGGGFHRQVSQISSTSSAFSSASSTFSSTSDFSDQANKSCSTKTKESYYDCNTTYYFGRHQDQNSKDSPTPSSVARRRSSYDGISINPYERKTQGNESTMKRDKHGRKQRDLIVQEDEEEEYPFAKYTFNKKPTRSDDSSSSVSTSSRLSSSRDSVHSIGLLKQHNLIQKSKIMSSRPSTTSLMSSITSSMNDSPESIEDLTSSINGGASGWKPKLFQSHNSTNNLFYPHMALNGDRKRRVSATPLQRDILQYDRMSAVDNNTEDFLKSFGLDEARSILPERFMKSWMDKVLSNQKKEIERRLSISSQDTGPSLNYYPEPYFVDDSDFLPPSVSAQQSGASTPQWRSSLENINMVRSTQDQSVGQRIGPRIKFRRSQTLNSSTSGYSGIMNDYSQSLEMEYGKAEPISMSKENSFDRLKHILQSNDPLVPYKDKDWRRNRFASARQKSLPIFLETLSEEEEERHQGRKGVDNKQKHNHISNMKTFLEEEEILSAKNSISSSDDTGLSDISLRNEVYLSESLTSLRNSLSTMGDDSECGLGLDNEENKSGDNNLCLPSIFVSENEVFRYDKDTDQHADNSSFAYRHVPDRPKSPNPENQNDLMKLDLKSKDSLEVAEIMNPNDKVVNPNDKVVNSNIFNMSQLDRGRSHAWPITAIRRPEKRNSSGSSSGKFLSINSEHDEKYLSPASSTTSPLIMSPVTVIEVKSLDNQHDSLEFDDNKDTDSSKTNSAEKHHQHNAARMQNHKNVGCSNNSSISLTKSDRRSETPKELSLERRRHTYEPTTDCCDTDSDDVFRELSQHTKSSENVDVSLQADACRLPPLLQLTEMKQLLQDMCSRLPSKMRENLFYMAQDKGVQCDLLTGVNTVVSEAKDEQLCKIRSQETDNYPEMYIEQYPVTERIDTIGCDEINIHDNKYSIQENEIKKIQNCNIKSEDSVQNREIETEDDIEITDIADFAEKHSKNDISCVPSIVQDRHSPFRKTHETVGVQTICRTHSNSGVNDWENCTTPCTMNKGRFTTEVLFYVGAETYNVNQINGQSDIPKSKCKSNGAGYYVIPINDDKPPQLNEYYTLITTRTPMDAYNKNSRDYCSNNNNENEESDSSSTNVLIANSGYIKDCKLNSIPVEARGNEPLFDPSLDTEYQLYLIEQERSVDMEENGYQSTTRTENYKHRPISDKESSRTERSMRQLEGKMNIPEEGRNDFAMPKHTKSAHEKEVYTDSITTKFSKSHSNECTEIHHELNTVHSYPAQPMSVCSVLVHELSGGHHDIGRKQSSAFMRPNGTENGKPSTLQMDEALGIVNQVNRSVQRYCDISISYKAEIMSSHVFEQKNMECEKEIEDNTIDDFKSDKSCDQLCLKEQLTEIQSSQEQTFQSEGSSRTIYSSGKEVFLCFSDTNRSLFGLSGDDSHNHVCQQRVVAEEATQEQNVEHCCKENEAMKYAHNTSLDRISQLSSRSLDFDTLGSRKNILRRSHGTMFSKSFEGGFDPAMDVNADTKSKKLSNVILNDNSVYPNTYVAEKKLRGLIKDVLKLNSNTNDITTDAKDMSYGQETGTNASGFSGAFYHVGKSYYNGDGEVDQDGRLQLMADLVHSTTGEVALGKLEDSEQGIHMTSDQDIRHDTAVSKICDLKDGLTKMDTKTCVVNKEFTDKISPLEELDKLYRLSVDNEEMLDEEYLFKTNDETDKTNTDSYDVDSFIEELDYELNQIEIYASKLKQNQIHMCRNCGYTAEHEATADACVLLSKVEHDFCCRCSPLDVSMETLERRRKMLKNSH